MISLTRLQARFREGDSIYRHLDLEAQDAVWGRRTVKSLHGAGSWLIILGIAVFGFVVFYFALLTDI